MSLPSVTPLVELALKELDSTPPTTQNILRLSATLAQAVNHWPELKGAQKAEMVVTALREVLGLEQIRGLISAEEQAALRVVVDTIVPETLAMMVSASRGDYDFRKPTPGCVAALAAVFCRTATALAPGSEAASQAATATTNASAPIPAPSSEKEVPQAAPEKVEIEVELVVSAPASEPSVSA